VQSTSLMLLVADVITWAIIEASLLSRAEVNSCSLTLKTIAVSPTIGNTATDVLTSDEPPYTSMADATHVTRKSSDEMPCPRYTMAFVTTPAS
jgi:hypothetical protein